MKQSVVKYVKLPDGQIKLVGFDHIATGNRLIRQFGAEVRKVYTSDGPWYLKANPMAILINDEEFKVGQVLSKETFQDMVSSMKVAGKRLMEIKDKIDTRVHEVKI